MPAQLLDRQIRALRVRAAFSGPALDRFSKGERDASIALAKILDAHPNEHGELYNALRAYLADGPALDSDDYERGGECVHSDVEFVLGGDRFTIAELLGALTEGT